MMRRGALLAASSLALSGALDNGLGLLPPMGYSSWNDCASEINEARIKNITLALIRTGLAAKGYVHVNVDEGWIKGRNATTGRMIEDRVKFPSGMKALGDWIHDQEVPGKGKIMKYGLYTSRGNCQCSTPLYSAPGSHGYEELDAQFMVEAGADYLKEDSCCGSQDHKTAFEDYSRMRDALNKTGRKVYFSLCGWNTWYAPEGDSLGNSWRIAGDGANWGALANAINQNAHLWRYAKPGAWNDPDLLLGTGVGSADLETNPRGCFLGKKVGETGYWYQTDEQSRAQFSMWAVMSAPLLISANIDQVSSYALETWGNEEVIAVSQSVRDSGPYMGVRVAGGDVSYDKGRKTGSGSNVWAKPLPKGDWALAFLNNGNNATNVTCDGGCLDSVAAAAEFGAPRYKVRDLWTRADNGIFDRKSRILSRPVPPHGGIVLLRLSPVGADARDSAKYV